MKKIVSFLVVFICSLCLLGCNQTSNEEPCEHTWDEGVKIETGLGEYVMEYTCTVCGKKEQKPISVVNENLLFARTEKINELTKYKETILDNVDVSLTNEISNKFEKYINEIAEANSIISINNLSKQCVKEVYDLIPLANGEFDFSNVSEVEKTKILSLIDNYIFRNNIGGIPISKYYTLNLNSTTKEKWNEFFGVNGSIYPTSEDKYWDVKLFLSNKYFLKGLSLALQKDTSKDYTTDYYQINYSEYEFYNHDLELSKKYFALAMEELFPSYAVSSQYPIELKLEIAFGTKTKASEELFDTLKYSIEFAFNDESVSNGAFVLTVEAWYGEYFGQIYSNKLYNGQFDLSYDKISGSSFDLYMVYKLLSSHSDLSNGLTINWSIDTNDIEDDCIIYNGYRFTYDSLVSLLSSKYTIIDGTF